MEIQPPEISDTGDYCEWIFDISENSHEFNKLIITFGLATTSAFPISQRDDDKKIIHGEGYTFYLWYKHEVEEYYKSNEYQKRMHDLEKEKNGEIDEKNDEISEKNDENDENDAPFATREETYQKIADFQEKVYSIMSEEEFSKAILEPLSNGLLFKISKGETSVDIDYMLLNKQYLGKCDQLYESFFNIIEKTFKYEIKDKDMLKVRDHIENGKVYCASNFYLRQQKGEKVVRVMNDDIVKMSDIEFNKMPTNTVKDFSYDLDYTTLPIKNIKVYFEKTQRVDSQGQALKVGSKDNHLYYTMNFHIFFTNYYGPNQEIEQKMINQIVDEMEAIYCLNFQCEPDLDNGMELNFTSKNTRVNPEHFMVVNYFKPSYMFEHMIQNAQDSEEIEEENREIEKKMSHERKMRLKNALILL
jgi:hypothetical protein